MAYRQTVRNAVPALMSLHGHLNDPLLDADARTFAEEGIMKADAFLIERKDALRRERHRLLDLEDFESLAVADFITMLLASYERAGDAATAAIDRACR